MTISNVTVLNSNGVDASLSVLRESGVAEPSVAQPPTSESAIVRISVRGKALASLDSLQAYAEASRNGEVPPTLTDFKVLVNGVVGSINALRASATASRNAQQHELHNRLNGAEEILNKRHQSSAALHGIGVESQADGAFAINTKRLTDAFNNDGKGAFAVVTEFARKASGRLSAQDASLSSKSDQDHAGDRSKGGYVAAGSAISFSAKKAVSTYSLVASLSSFTG